ncbi:hypothetical protein CHS0354_036325 [Potamilus streckersoni]|uniref:G-protein coupled receptors family 3 profile domain-containing protein n=1 Tax=Potamilus streckersoni TaxID=2493646 RepID=A0AAE0VGH7_9BIVA|nr:hypothetical protein CHS0354_036325 [Potamilus streckersoni]
MNYQKVKDSSGNETYQYNRVGTWVAGHLRMNDSDVYWPTRGFTPPIKSTCSDACPRGFVKKIHRNIACCWVCTPCEDNEIMMDSYTCKPCNRGWWPNENLTACRVIPIEYTSWWTTEAMATLITVSFGIFVTLWITVVFLRHNNTPVVKASTRELSYIILVGIIAAYSSNFVILAKPTMVTCYFTRIIPGLSFSLIYGALVTKTNRIARILEGTKKIITKKPRFMSASAQVIITCILVGVECAITTIMLVIEPADSKLDYSQSKRVRLICNTTTPGIIVPLTFDLILIFLCTLYAIKTRNLPENFNEAKFIGFSMYTTCVIWLGFLAIYFGSDQRVITLSISVSLSATVALVLLFFPKVYVMIWTPEKNTRSAFTTSKEVRCHIGSISCASGESIDLIRDRKSADLLRVPLQRKASLLSRLRCSGQSSYVLQKQNSQKVCRTSSMLLTRGNSFHVPVTRSNNQNHQTFSWAKLASKNEESHKDRLSTISSKEDSPEFRKGFRTSKTERLDVACQTEGLRSINNLRQRQNPKRPIYIGHAEMHSINAKDNGENICLRTLSASSSESGCLVGKSKKQYNSAIRAHPFQGNPECSASSSDDFENEDDFVYYDSISDLLKVRTSGRSSKPHITSSDKYIKYTPEIMRSSTNQETCLTFKNISAGNINLQVPDRDLTLLSPQECKMKITKNLSDSCIRHCESDSKESYSCPYVRHSFSNILFEGRSFRNIDTLPLISADNVHAGSNSKCLSIDSSAIQIVTGKESKSPSHSSFCSITSSPRSTSNVYRCLDNVSDKCVLALDEEEESMLLFQSFLRERGVEFDMSYVESSDV